MRANRALRALVLVTVAAVTSVGCSSEDPPPQVDVPVASAPQVDPGGVAVLRLGQPATVSRRDGDGTVSVDRFEFYTTPVSDGVKRPTTGTFLKLTVTFRGKNGKFFVSPMDFVAVTDDRQAFKQLSGTTFLEGVAAGEIAQGDIGPGETRTGIVIIDAPRAVTQINYAPALGTTIARWTLPQS